MTDKIVVVGDVILDKIVLCEAKRVSAEAPVLVACETDGMFYALGGAANVAKNVLALGGSPQLVGNVGADDDGQQLSVLCRMDVAQEYEPVLRTIANHRTTTKTRFIAGGQLVFRFDTEGSIGSTPLQLDRGILDGCSVLILSDYNKGMFWDQESTQYLIKDAKDRGILVIADVRPQNAWAFRGVNWIVPNESELRAIRVMGCERPSDRNPDADVCNMWDLPLVCRNVAEAYRFDRIICTRGSSGIADYHRGADTLVEYPTNARSVADVTGAGDTVVASMAIDDDVHRANVAAGLAVGKLGTIAVTQDEVESVLTEDQILSKFVDDSRLRTHVVTAQADGRVIVFTNGCFDMLHPGHAHLLTQACKQGDVLVVAVNADSSVEECKGKDRPVLPLDVRMRALASLEAVDYVVSFNETTPERLIRFIKPDVLVKGRDPSNPGIPGADFVARSGGRIHIVDTIPGFSTTDTLRTAIFSNTDQEG